MTRRMKICLIAVAVIVVILGIAVCMAIFSSRRDHVAPAPMSSQEPIEVEDCDKGDQAKGEWWEGCTIGPHPTPSAVKTRAPVAPKTPCIPRATRKCR